MRLRAQIALMTIGMVLATVAVVLGVGYERLRMSLVEIAENNVQLSSTLVRQYVRTEIRGVEESAGYLALRIQSDPKPLSPSTLPEYRNTLLSLVRAFGDLTYASISLAGTGDYMHVERKPETGRIVLQTSLREPNGTFTMREYDPVRSLTVPFRQERNWDYDPRKRPFFLRVKDQREAAWTPTYGFVRSGGQPVVGVTCAVPVRGRDGRLLGVVTADMTLNNLRGVVKSIQLGRSGQVFVVEERPDGALRLIAHPNADLMGDEGIKKHREEAQPVVLAMNELRQRMSAKGPRASGGLDFQLDGVRYFGGFVPIDAGGNPAWSVFSIMREEDILVGLRRTSTLLVGFSLVALLGSFGLSIWLARRIAQPLSVLATETDRLQRLDFTERPLPSSRIVEIINLVDSVRRMRSTFASFQKLVPARYARHLLSEGKEAELGGERRRLTILFCDIADFSTYSEQNDAETTFEILGRYLQAISEAVVAEEGTIDKYTGDGLMAFWGAPVAVKDAEAAACRAALRSVAAIEALRAEGLPFRLRFGIATGEVLVGNVGSRTRLNYTVLGDSANLAARLEPLNKDYGTTILVDEVTYQAVQTKLAVRLVDRVQVKGRERFEAVYEVTGLGASDAGV